MEMTDNKKDKILSINKTLEQMLKTVRFMLENYKPLFNGERYLTNEDLSKRLNISRRTLQDYRSNGMIPYILLGGKILYRESDVQKILERAYIKAWKE